METNNVFRLNRDRITANQPALTASAPSSAKPKLLDQVRHAIRTRHLPPRPCPPGAHWGILSTPSGLAAPVESEKIDT